jgi:hypothetical protein
MNPFARYPRRSAAAALGVLLLAAACTDRSPVAPEPEPGETPGGTPGRPVHLVAVSCRVDVKAGTARCDDDPEPEGPATDLILGGQNQYVNLELGAVNYDHGTSSYQLDVSVRNLIQQPLGTTDGVSLDPNGVRVFLQAGPNTTTGSGNVTVIPDGLGTFTATNQPYYQYNSVLDQFETSAPRTWSFQMPATVTAFAFTAYVSAAVQFPDGWVEVSAAPITMHPHASLKLSATARDAAGNFVPGAQVFTWSSSDTTVATVTPSGSAGGLLTSIRAGTISINVDASAAAVSRVGAVQVTVTGMQRVWEGDVSTDYHTRANWANNIVPVALDTIVIPNPSVNYPLINQNTQVAGIQVAEGATLNLGAYDMTASRNVVSSTTGGTGIISTTGRLFLSGTAGTVSGRLPRLRVTGTYSLTGTVWITAPLQVDAGRLTSTGYRLESNNTL